VPPSHALSKQAPFAQCWPAEHMVPHEPQCASSVSVETQSDPQAVVPSVHEVTGGGEDGHAESSDASRAARRRGIERE
jgi:hypothetical protein